VAPVDDSHGTPPKQYRGSPHRRARMEPSSIADDLNEVSVLVNVAHRLLLSVRDDVETSPSLQAIIEDLDVAHEQLDLALERIGQAVERADAEADGGGGNQPRVIH
jgi:hypothetical protein